MELILPNKVASEPVILEDVKSVVVIGANGSGKTRFGRDIEARYDEKTHRISAQKSLTMPKEVSPKSKLRAESEFRYGFYDENNPTVNLHYKFTQRWGQNPNTFLLNDYEKLMVLLHTDEYEESIKFKENYEPKQANAKPFTKLDQVKRIWEYVLPHRKLTIKAGSIDTYPTSDSSSQYNASEMSDGERVVFYLIGEVVSVPEDSFIIVDEPEMHIHKTVTKKLWDKIEQERPDCTFIYLTHDIDFASSREGGTKVWAKGFDGTHWDYEIIDGTSTLPEQLYLEILGSRNPILFIEGNDSSIDYKLLQLVFTDYTTKPIGGCQKVIATTKSFNEQNDFHNIQSFGLIDRDRRTDEEVSHLTSSKIGVFKVSEVENLLLLENVVKIVAKNMMQESQEVFSEVKKNVIEFFKGQVERQAMEHTIARLERIFRTVLDSSMAKEIDDLVASLGTFWGKQDFKAINAEIKASFDKLIDDDDYNGILKVFNNKGIVANSEVSRLCDLNTSNDAYLNYVLGIIKKDCEDSEAIKSAIIENIENPPG